MMTTRDEMLWHLARLSGELTARGHDCVVEGAEDPVKDPVPRLWVCDLDVRVSVALINGVWWYSWWLELIAPCRELAAADRLCGVEVAP